MRYVNKEDLSKLIEKAEGVSVFVRFDINAVSSSEVGDYIQVPKTAALKLLGLGDRFGVTHNMGHLYIGG